MQDFFKDDVVAQAYLAVLDAELYNKIKKIAKEVSLMDHEMSSFIIKFKKSQGKDRIDAAMELGGFYNKAYNFYDSFPDKLGNILP
jgi:hypothetical protein